MSFSSNNTSSNYRRGGYDNQYNNNNDNNRRYDDNSNSNNNYRGNSNRGGWGGQQQTERQQQPSLNMNSTVILNQNNPQGNTMEMEDISAQKIKVASTPLSEFVKSKGARCLGSVNPNTEAVIADCLAYLSIK